MSIRRIDSPIVPTRSTETQSPTTAKPANTVRTPANSQSEFTPTKRAPTDLTGATARPAQIPGPLATNSKEGQAAIQTTLNYLSQQGPAAESFRGGNSRPGFDASQAFSPRTVERDELGMTHVRMDRTHEGVKVFGEQVISHLDREGKVDSVTGETSDIPAGLGKQELKLSNKDALAIAKKEFNGKTDRTPISERVIYQDENGKYRSGYRVELSNTSGAEESPRRMNYLIDGETGKVALKYNQIGGIERPVKTREATPTTVTGAATPNEAIKDLATTSSKISLGDDVAIDTLKLNLDIAHTYRGDLKVTLTSPSGKSAVISDRKGGSADDLKGDFDLSQFAGESTKGEWTLTVEDKAKRDTGTLKGWSLTATGKKAEPPPPPPAGGADDTSLYSGKVDLATKKNADGTYSLDDSTRGQGVVTLDANNKERASGATAITDKNNVWGETTDDPRSKAAVDAQYGAQMTYDFYKEVLGRDSLDGKGEKLVSNVHISKNYVNAFWDGKQMNYGDGNGKDAGPLTTLDIAGHEITHGLTERTAGLIYSGESGGLNEAFSDIMGTGVEWYAAQKNPAVKFDFAVGEDAWTPTNGDATDALRYMNDPTADGYSVDHYKNYPKQTEVHGSSGIANNAFYLLTQGGKNRTSGMEVKDGIGMEKSLKIYGRALTTYMTPKTTFSQARDATIKAATDLYGADSAEVQKVKDSWAAVGVNSK